MLYLKSDNAEQILQQGNSHRKSSPTAHSELKLPPAVCYSRHSTRPGNNASTTSEHNWPLGVLGGKQDSFKTWNCLLSYLTIESKKHECCPIVINYCYYSCNCWFNPAHIQRTSGKCCGTKSGASKKKIKSHPFLLWIQPHALCIPATRNRFHHPITAHTVHWEMFEIMLYREFLLKICSKYSLPVLSEEQGISSHNCLLLRYSCLTYYTTYIKLCIHKQLQNYRWDEGQRKKPHLDQSEKF